MKKFLASVGMLTLLVVPVFAQDAAAPAAAAPAAAPAPMAKKAKAAAKKGGDEEGIKKAFDGFSEAWAAGDAAKAASFVVPEGSLINPFGVEAHGRKEVEQVIGADIQMMKGSSQSFSDYTIEFILPNLAMVDTTGTVNMKNADGTDAEPHKFHVYAVVVNRGKGWQARAIRPYSFAKQPSADDAAAAPAAAAPDEKPAMKKLDKDADKK